MDYSHSSVEFLEAKLKKLEAIIATRTESNMGNLREQHADLIDAITTAKKRKQL